MHQLTSILAIMMLAATAQADDSGTSWKIHGKVVDERGKPVDDFDAATFWSSNGKQWDEKGERIKATGLEGRRKLWKEEGVLAAYPKALAKRLHAWQTGSRIISATGVLLCFGPRSSLAQNRSIELCGFFP